MIKGRRVPLSIIIILIFTVQDGCKSGINRGGIEGKDLFRELVLKPESLKLVSRKPSFSTHPPAPPPAGGAKTAIPFWEGVFLISGFVARNRLTNPETEARLEPHVRYQAPKFQKIQFPGCYPLMSLKPCFFENNRLNISKMGTSIGIKAFPPDFLGGKIIFVLFSG